MPAEAQPRGPFPAAQAAGPRPRPLFSGRTPRRQALRGRGPLQASLSPSPAPVLLRFVRARRTVRMANIYRREEKANSPAARPGGRRGPGRSRGQPLWRDAGAQASGPRSVSPLETRVRPRLPHTARGTAGHSDDTGRAWSCTRGRALRGPGLLTRGQGTQQGGGFGGQLPPPSALRRGGHVDPPTRWCDAQGWTQSPRAQRAQSTGGQSLRTRGDAPPVPSRGGHGPGPTDEGDWGAQGVGLTPPLPRRLRQPRPASRSTEGGPPHPKEGPAGAGHGQGLGLRAEQVSGGEEDGPQPRWGAKGHVTVGPSFWGGQYP